MPIEVYIEQPPIRRLIDRWSRSAWYLSALCLAVFSVVYPDAEITAVPHGTVWDFIIAVILGVSSAVGVYATMRGRRMIELGVSSFVAAGLIPFCVGAIVDHDMAMAAATAIAICATVARGNTLRTAVLRATTVKEMVNYTNGDHAS